MKIGRLTRHMRNRTENGSSIVESIIAAMVLVPIALAILDLIVVVSACSMNDTAARNAARAAANQATQPLAMQAAQNALSTFHKSSIIPSLLASVTYSKETVTVNTTMKVKLPIPFPGFNELSFNAKDVEPIMVHE